MQTGNVKKKDLINAPFTQLHPQGIRGVFNPTEIDEILDMTEGRCTGIPKIIRAMKANGSPPPLFETDDDRSYFLTTLKIRPQYIKQLKENKEAFIQPKSQIESGVGSEPLRIHILHLLKEKEHSKK